MLHGWGGQPVGMAGGGHHVDTELAEIINEGAQHVDVRLTGIAAPGTDLTQLERAGKEATGAARRRQRARHAGQDQIFPAEGRQMVMVLAPRKKK